MALILGVWKNARFFVDDVQCRVVDTVEFSTIVLEIEGKEWTITDQRAIEVFPKVLMSVGTPKQQQVDGGIVLLPRLVIEAPREIIILRSGLYRKRQFEREEEDGRKV